MTENQSTESVALTVGAHVSYRRAGQTYRGDIVAIVAGEKYGVLVKGMNGKTYLLSEEKVRLAEPYTEDEKAEIKAIEEMVQDMKQTALGRHYTNSGLREIAREMHALGWANDSVEQAEVEATKAKIAEQVAASAEVSESFLSN